MSQSLRLFESNLPDKTPELSVYEADVSVFRVRHWTNSVNQRINADSK